MDVLTLLMKGFGDALTSLNFLYLFVGVLFGNLVGVLPGLGPVQGTALLIPFTFKLPPATAIIMLARSLLWGNVWWFNNLNPPQHPG